MYDGLGSVVGEVDPTGALTRSQSFDVYGAVRSSQGTSTTKHKFVGSLGHPSEDETGLIYMRARYMDPVIGRFVSEDPAGDGANWFGYCDNDPINKIDRTGCEGSLIEINFTITINDSTFSVNITVNLTTQQVVGGLRQMFTSEKGQRLAMFMFRRALGKSDSAIAMMIKLLNDDGSLDELWHAVVDLSGKVIHRHIH